MTSNIDGKLGVGDTFEVSDLSEGVHTITLSATDSDGNWRSKTITITIAPIHSPPTNVKATAGYSKVTISWDLVSNEDSYNIYYSTTSGVDKTTGAKIAGVTSPYEVTGLTNGTTYYFVVTAENALGESDESSQVWAKPSSTTSRFTDNGDGTVTDNETGLIWLKNADCFGRQNWANAINLSNNLASGACGLTDGSSPGDWRLPNRNELLSLVDYAQHEPALPLGHPFSSVVSSYYPYWTSTTSEGLSGDAWDVNLNIGSLSLSIKSNSFHVWPVRGVGNIFKTGQTNSHLAYDDGSLQKGLSWPTPRFSDNGNGTVTDNMTGLIWLEDAACLGSQSWSNAMTVANSLADGACGLTDGSSAGDWCLPSVNELEPLIHKGFYYPALPNTQGTGKWSEGDPFSGVVTTRYWTSTTLSNNANRAWLVNLYYGDLNAYDKTTTVIVWPVRCGQ